MRKRKEQMDFTGLDAIIVVITFIVLVVLRLFNVIQWSWAWIFAPLWVPFVFSAVVVSAILIISIVESIIKRLKNG